MINVFVFLLLFIAIAVNNYLLGKLNNIGFDLKNSILFLVNNLIIITIIEWFISTMTFQNISDARSIDKLISFNSLAISVRNTVILVSLFYLSYGIYKEYLDKKKKWLLLLSGLFILISTLFLALVLMAELFTI